MLNPAGLYLHIPFCEKKCNYCDFYSTFATDELLDNYTACLIEKIKQWGGSFNRPIDTIYLGGGTPSLLSFRLGSVITAVKENFEVLPNSEITLELNPSKDIKPVLQYARLAGINRLSIGAQSGINHELKTLGRTHTAEDTKRAVFLARQLGFNNISLDIMLGLPSSSAKTLQQSLNFLDSLYPEHISAYMLKIEEKTAFYLKKDSLCLPTDEKTAEQYLLMCDFFESRGYCHYEISNLAKNGFESRHNLKYWQGDDYLGLGPSAHSNINKKRFYFERDLKGFLNQNAPIPDGESGGIDEFVMLRLRLKNGIDFNEFQEQFKAPFPPKALELCKKLEKVGLCKIDSRHLRLTNNGMLLSNSIITEIMETLE